MHITLIGGSGFVGTRLAARLVSVGHTVTIADKNDSKKYPHLRLHADVREPEALEKSLAGSDVAVNLAAEHRDDVTPKSLYDDVNVTGAENLCNVCTKLGIKKIIFTSSVAVYGFAPVGTDETGAVNYFNDYGRTKWLAEEKYRAWLASDPENSLTIIRPTVIFGEQNRGMCIICCGKLRMGNSLWSEREQMSNPWPMSKTWPPSSNTTSTIPPVNNYLTTSTNLILT
jgi:nucleoside-diphosphate-sugar epimerase